MHMSCDRRAYNAARHHANSVSKRTREIYYRERIDEASGPRQQCKVVNNLLHTEPKNELQSPEECERLFQGLSDFFRDKILKIRTSISLILQFLPASFIVQCIRRHTGSSLNVLASFSIEEVVKLVTAMQSKSSPMDILPTSFLKSCINVIATAIAHMINLSFLEGYFPDGFQTAQILPLLKTREWIATTMPMIDRYQI